MYNASDVAKYILDFSCRINVPATNLRLQKLLYFVQGNSYFWNDKPMFNDDFYAWQYGPVVPEVYFDYAVNAGSPINPYIIPRFKLPNIASNDEKIIYGTLVMFKDLSDWKLVELSHEVGGPWSRHQSDKSIIPKNEIRDYFVAMRPQNGI